MPSFIRHFNSIRTGQLVVIIIPMELLQPSRYAGYLMNYLCSSPFFSSPLCTAIKSLSDVSLTGRRSYLAIDWPMSRTSGNGNMERMFENEIPLGNYRMPPPQSTHHSRTGAVATPAAIELKFVNELGQPVVVGGPVKYYGQKQQQQQQPHRANYESVSDKQQQFIMPSLVDPGMAPTTKMANHLRMQFYSIEFQLRPLSERGLLVFFGAFDNELDETLGFVSLSLQGGVVEFRVSARKEHTTVLRSNRILAIGEWHKIRLSQSGRRMSLWVEGAAVSTTTEYNGLNIPRESRIYIGGLPDLSKLPLSSISGFPVPYRGCVRQVVVSGVRVVLNETNIRGEAFLFLVYCWGGGGISQTDVNPLPCRITEHPGLRWNVVRR